MLGGGTPTLRAERKLSILLVEDNPDHAALLRLSLKYDRRVANIEWVCEAPDALRLLRNRGANFDVVLLDLDLGLTSGFDVIEDIKRDADLRRLPVVVLSTSDAPRDRRRAYDLHANSYIVKPLDGRSLAPKLGEVLHYWACCDAGAPRER